MKMKDKRLTDIKKRDKHIAQLRETKAKRRKNPSLDRKPKDKLIKPTILIVCEGANTEPSYLKQFKLLSAKVKIMGEGYNTISLVEKTIELKKEATYEQVWCVFDKDDFEPNDFNSAILKAKSKEIKVAYSNQAFEYWLILHFEDHQGGGMHRDDYGAKLNSYLNPLGQHYDYKGNKKITEDIFELLLSQERNKRKTRLQLAILRAKKIYSKLDNISPALEESSTTVYQLVEELLKYSS